MNDFEKHIVSSIPRSSYPYTSISLSPYRHNAILAGNDTLKLVSLSAAGISELKSFRVSQYFFHSSTPVNTAPPSASQHGDVREAFGLFTSKAASTATSSSGNIVITDVAWSPSLNPQAVNDIAINIAVESGINTTTSIAPEAIITHKTAITDNSAVAAAGSNGTVLVWHISKALFALSKEAQFPQNTATNRRHQQQKQLQPTLFGQPEAILSGHSRAVNRLAFNPRKPNLLLTASQDATVKLWERRVSGSNNAPMPSSVGGDSAAGGSVLLSFLGLHNNNPGGNKAKIADASPPPSWQCIATFQPKSDAVRDVKWSRFHEDIFAMTTETGYLIIYDIRVVARPFLRLAAHAGECTCVDWHPTRPYILATGGGRDRSVKVWDVEQSLNLDIFSRQMSYTKVNSFSNRSDESSGSAIVSEAASLEDSSPVYAPLSSSPIHHHLNPPLIGPSATWLHLSHSHKTQQSTNNMLRSQASVGRSIGKDRALKCLAATNMHTLSIGSPVTRLRWRPPSSSNNLNQGINHHDGMLAVATGPVSGTNALGHGCVGLWSVHRPFLPLSVVKGHEEGPISDFFWLDTPAHAQLSTEESQLQHDNKDGDVFIDSAKFKHMDLNEEANSDGAIYRKLRSNREQQVWPSDRKLRSNREQQQLSFFHQEELNRHLSLTHSNLEISDVLNSSTPPLAFWQHVVSVGRDGQCLLQSFARGVRLINKIPPSVIAVAPFTPFKPGNGSLLLVSVHQDVPSGPVNDFLLTRLRCDSRAPGVFREFLSPEAASNQLFAKIKSNNIPSDQLGADKGRKKVLNLTLTSIDSNDVTCKADEMAIPYVTVSPELQHFSHFARCYRHRFEPIFPTRSSLCLHNASVAEGVQAGSLQRMWKILASLLKGSDFDNPATNCKNPGVVLAPGAFSFLLWQTLKKLLTEIADAGDVQTCVAICGIMDVIVPEESDSSCPLVTSRVPGIDIDLIREWYLSYIEILQQHGLFLISTEIIRTCPDPLIGGLNRNSTTIHESCSFCGKPLQGVTTYQEDEPTDAPHEDESIKKPRRKPVLTTQRACGYCRNRIGLCFLCQLPVKDCFVWCPGCGHGGHLHHAAQWFGHDKGQQGEEYCPTGCGHKCNFVRQGPLTSSFPICMST